MDLKWGARFNDCVPIHRRLVPTAARVESAQASIVWVAWIAPKQLEGNAAQKLRKTVRRKIVRNPESE
jgi:hypothetical protein